MYSDADGIMLSDCQKDSYKLPVAFENETVVAFLSIRIVAMDFQDFGDGALAQLEFEMRDDVDGIADIAIDGAVGRPHCSQNTTREAR
jgi:hypothetical protein